jgi:hypothetical protein
VEGRKIKRTIVKNEINFRCLIEEKKKETKIEVFSYSKSSKTISRTGIAKT